MKYIYDDEESYQDDYLYNSGIGYYSADNQTTMEQDCSLDDNAFEHEAYFEVGALADEIAQMKTKPTHEVFELITQDGMTHRIRMGTLWHLGSGRIIISSKIGDFEALEIPPEPITVKKPPSAPSSPVMMSLAALNSVCEARVH